MTECLPTLSPANWFHEALTQVMDVDCGRKKEVGLLAYVTLRP